MHIKFILIFILLQSYAHGHGGTHGAPASAPPADYGEFSTPTSHGGYGYLDSSEAQARSAFDFTCSDRRVATLIRNACGEVDGAPLSGSDGEVVNRMARGPFQSYLSRMLRRQVYEQAGLQMFANSGGNGGVIDPPDRECFDSSDIASEPMNSLSRLRGARAGAERDLGITGGRAPTTAELATLRPPLATAEVARAAASLDQVTNSSLVSGIITASYFNRALFCLCHRNGPADEYCGTIRTNAGVVGTTVLPSTATQCRSLTHTLFRLKNTYPGIFEDISDGSTSMNEYAQAALIRMMPLLGGNATEVGLKQLLEGTSIDARGPSSLITRVLAVIDQPRGGDLRAALQGMRDRQATVAQNSYTNLCSSQTSDLILDNPQAVRQMLIDAEDRSSEERDILRAALCQSEEFRQLKDRHCQTKYPISHMRDPVNGEDYQVIRGTNMTDYPFAGNVNYRMRHYESGGHPRAQVRLRLNLVVQPGATLTQAQLDSWKTQTQEYYNSEARRNGRRIDFEFDFTQGPAVDDGVNVNFHQYWCATCSPSLPPPNSVPPARDHGPADGNDGRWSQADGGNFPADVSLQTINHEIGHGLGLSDEYSADYYNFNTIGEPDSLMVSGNRLYNRHFNRMMAPNDCY